MRFKFALAAAIGALTFAGAAAAGTVSLAPISFSEEFQTELDDEYGAREGEYLRETITDAVTRALAREGATVASGAPLTIEISIVDADPNRPTFQQVTQTPGLDSFRSLSIGGAELHAVLRDASGAVVTEVSHRRYDQTLWDAQGSSTWSEARQAIRGFANRVADAYVANAR